MPQSFSNLSLLTGCALLQLASQTDYAVSQESESVRLSISDLVDFGDCSFALFGAKSAAISQIWNLAAECSLQNWDGEDSRPVDQLAAILGEDFIRAMPDDLPLPEFAPEPDGAISLDWIESRHRLFSLSIGASNRLAFAWIDGADRGHGVARFDGETIPLRILQGIKDIVRKEYASLRTA